MRKYIRDVIRENNMLMNGLINSIPQLAAENRNLEMANDTGNLIFNVRRNHRLRRILLNYHETGRYDFRTLNLHCVSQALCTEVFCELYDEIEMDDFVQRGDCGKISVPIEEVYRVGRLIETENKNLNTFIQTTRQKYDIEWPGRSHYTQVI